MGRREYANGTWLETSTMWNLYCHGAALCSDGKVHVLARIAKTADTFFSIPAAVQVKGKTVSGYVTLKDISKPMDVTSGTLNGSDTVAFFATGKNASMLPDWDSPLNAEPGTETVVIETVNCQVILTGRGFYARCTNCPWVTEHTASKSTARQWAHEHEEKLVVDDYTTGPKSDPCAVCGNTPTDAASEAGERLCAEHGEQDQANGEDITWDEDACEGTADRPAAGYYCNHDVIACTWQRQQLVCECGTIMDTESSASRQHYVDTGRYLPAPGRKLAAPCPYTTDERAAFVRAEVAAHGSLADELDALVTAALTEVTEAEHNGTN